MLESSTFKMEGRGCPGGWVERTSLGKNGELFFRVGLGVKNGKGLKMVRLFRWEQHGATGLI